MKYCKNVTTFGAVTPVYEFNVWKQGTLSYYSRISILQGVHLEVGPRLHQITEKSEHMDYDNGKHIVSCFSIYCLGMLKVHS
jgi:hypothetical protein